MPIAGMGTCPTCKAMVNSAWNRCVACDQPMTKADRLTTESAGTNKEKAEAGTQTAFDLNAGPIPRPAVQHNHYKPGEVVEIHSPLFGHFHTEILKACGSIVWVWHPTLEREAAIPGEWVAEEGTPAP